MYFLVWVVVFIGYVYMFDFYEQRVNVVREDFVRNGVFGVVIVKVCDI